MIFLPPDNIAYRDRSKKSVFLAGSIEMGKAEDWQKTLGNKLIEKNFNVFNPRREDWDSSWVQHYRDPNFSQQVNWELNALKISDYVIMYLEPQTTSPISLLEFGLYAPSNKLFMVCPDGFYRKGNVDIVCSLYDVPLYNTINELLNNHIFK
jgi:hypothetical protein